MLNKKITNWGACVLLVFVFASAPSVAQTGHVLNGIGAVNQGMAGTGVAAPLDASGALNWNPGSISRLGRNEIQFSMEMMKPDIEMSSSNPMLGGFGLPTEGTSESKEAIFAIPSFAMVYGIEDSEWTFGMGAFGIGGFGVDYAASDSNPLLMPAGLGFGAIYSQFQMLQVAPTFSRTLGDNWSVGFAPTINQAQLAVDPGCFGAPDVIDPDGNPGTGDEYAVYPSASHADSAWGYGAQFGAMYKGDDGWNFGVSYKTEQTFDNFEYNSVDTNGAYQELTLDMDFPAIASLGASYTGLDKWTFAFDAKYIDYSATDGFGEASFEEDFSVGGFGWDSIMVYSLGVNYDLDDCVALRAGYAYNDNPIPDANATFNVPAPAIIQQHMSAGISYCVQENWFLDLAYHHGFENEIEGEMGHPFMGSVPGTSVNNKMSTDSLVIGFRVNF